MAVTRSFLRGMGLTDEQVSAIIEEHANTVTALKTERDQFKADAEKLPEVQAQLEAAKSGEDWKQKFDTLQKTFDEYKQTVKDQETESRIKTAYRGLLQSASVDDRRIDAILKVTDLKALQIDADGKLVDEKKLLDGIKSEWSAFITSTSTRGTSVETPPATTNAGLTKAEIYAKDERGHYKLSTAERQKALAEHPELLR